MHLKLSGKERWKGEKGEVKMVTSMVISQALTTYAGWICTLARKHTHLYAGRISIRIPVLSLSAIKWRRNSFLLTEWTSQKQNDDGRLDDRPKQMKEDGTSDQIPFQRSRTMPAWDESIKLGGNDTSTQRHSMGVWVHQINFQYMPLNVSHL